MIRLVVLYIISICFINFAYAIVDGSDDIINKIDQQLSHQDKAYGTFEQKKYINVLPQPLYSSGEFYFEKKSGLQWIIQKPIASEIVFDDTGIHQRQGGNIIWESDRNEPSTNYMGEIIQAILSTDWNKLSSHFIIKGETNNTSWKISLTPKEETIKKQITTILLAGDQYIKTMSIIENNNNHTEITFSVASP